jgi:CheY-like chemotaxis protein
MGRVLVVDDDTGIRELLRVVLELEGFDVATARDGQEALDLLAASPEGVVVLMDVMMPRLGGLEVCERLAARGLAGRHRVALMTAGLLEEAECPRAVRALLRKPFNLEEIARVAHRLYADLVPLTPPLTVEDLPLRAAS